MLLYHIGAILKIVVGAIIILSVYMTIYPQEDPAIALGFGFLGFFVTVRGVSFYIFYGTYVLMSSHTSLLCAKKSYQLSLLFGLYALINVALLLNGVWTRVRGVVLLCIFIAIQIFLSLDNTPTDHGEESFAD